MSLRGQEFRCELDPEIHNMLRLMAEYYNVNLGQHGARLLEKMIVAEMHDFMLLAERMARTGIVRKTSDADLKR